MMVLVLGDNRSSSPSSGWFTLAPDAENAALLLPH